VHLHMNCTITKDARIGKSGSSHPVGGEAPAKLQGCRKIRLVARRQSTVLALQAWHGSWAMKQGNLEGAHAFSSGEATRASR
jgi:hypothetical protein